jgi:hypothetical protein
LDGDGEGDEDSDDDLFLPDTAGERGAADHDRGDGVEFLPGAGGGGPEPSRR